MSHRPLSHWGAKYFKMAIVNAMNAAEPDPLILPEPVPFEAQLKASDYHIRIAKDLMAATYVYHEMEVPVWADLPQGVRQRYLDMAERAIKTAGTEVRQRLIDRAVAHVARWMDAPYGGRGTEPTPEEIAREAVTFYECSLSDVPPEVR